MANVKISALSSLSSVSDSTVLPVVDGGTTQKTTALAVKTYATQAISANLGAYETWANASVTSLQNQITGANTNIATNATNIQTLSANVGAYETWANASVTSLQNQITGANTNIATNATNIQTLSANVGAYETWANVNLGGGGSTYSNANVASYLPVYSGNVLAANIIQTATGQITTPSGTNGNITLNPDGSGYVIFTNITPVIMGNTLQVRDVRDTVYTIASGSGTTTGTITPDPANGDLQVLTLTGSITFNAFNNPQSGQTVTFAVTQPSSGGPYLLTSSMKFAGGNKTLSTAANATDLLTVTYVNSTIGYLASLVTGFA
jgi:hypothetical protein